MSELNKNQITAVNRIIAEYMGIRLDKYYLDIGPDLNGNPALDLNKPELPNYTSEDSPRRLLAEVEAKVIAEFGESELWYGLRKAMRPVIKPIYCFATAEQRASAIVLTLGRWSDVEQVGGV